MCFNHFVHVLFQVLYLYRCNVCVHVCVCVCVCVCARARACLCVGWRGVEMSVHVGEKREEWWKAGVYVSAGVR